MKWEHLLEGISVIDSVCWHEYRVSHCGRGRTLKDGGLDHEGQSGLLALETDTETVSACS